MGLPRKETANEPTSRRREARDGRRRANGERELEGEKGDGGRIVVIVDNIKV